MEKCGTVGCNNAAQGALLVTRPERRRVVLKVEFGLVPASRSLNNYRCRDCMLRELPALVQTFTSPDLELCQECEENGENSHAHRASRGDAG